MSAPPRVFARRRRAIPVWQAHQMAGTRKGARSLHVTRNWRSTFGVDVAEGDILDVNYEDYH